jgi:glutamyl-tRNA synthetase
VAQPLRVALTGKTASPGLFETMCVLGRAESLARIKRALSL